MIKEVKSALIPIMLTAIISGVSTFLVTVKEVSANGEQGKRNGEEIKELRSDISDIKARQSNMDGKLDLLVERAKLGR